MARQIKFKAKAKETGEWFFGSYVYLPDSNSHHIIPFGTYKPHINACGLAQVEIDPETLGMFTGIEDKNGTEIYEGDILHIQRGDEDEAYISTVGKYGEIDYDMGDYESTLLDWIDDCTYEVIGNVHDTPQIHDGNAEDKG